MLLRERFSVEPISNESYRGRNIAPYHGLRIVDRMRHVPTLVSLEEAKQLVAILSQHTNLPKE